MYIHTYLSHFMQSQITSGFKNGVWKVSPAEIKIMLVLCYYALFGIVSLSLLSVQTTEVEHVIEAIKQYFVCEAAGSGMECDRSGFDHFAHNGLIFLIYLLLGLMPTVNLIFVINWTAAKESFKNIWKRHSWIGFSTQSTFVSSKRTCSTIETGV